VSTFSQCSKKGSRSSSGVAEDSQFGSFLALGLGRFYVETLKNYSVRLIPVNENDVEEMLNELRSKDIFSYRRKKFDKRAVLELAVRVSEIMEKENTLEMDLNAVFVYEKGYAVADARIVIGKRGDFETKIREVSYQCKEDCSG